MLFWQRDERVLARFGVGFLMIFLTAHLLYMVVPGWGPYWYFNGSFQHELHGGTFWPLVRQTVDGGGAQKDIFPSLHTAVPTFIAIFSFRNRRLVPFKYSWPVMAFVATQIIIATLFLRWHYLVDVVAGLTLATTAAFLGPAHRGLGGRAQRAHEHSARVGAPRVSLEQAVRRLRRNAHAWIRDHRHRPLRARTPGHERRSVARDGHERRVDLQAIGHQAAPLRA